MKTLISKTATDPVNILLIGNNPIEMGPVLDKLKQVRTRKIITEIAFDLKSIVERLVKFNPNFIFIDDNIGRDELMQTVTRLSANRKTRDIPITVLKNNNYREALDASSIQDYLLKQNLTTEALYNTIKNTLRFKKTQRYLAQATSRSKNGIMKFFEKRA